MTTTRDRERLDADAMKTQRMDNSVVPIVVVARRSLRCGVAPGKQIAGIG
jgi:hypothetical protein